MIRSIIAQELASPRVGVAVRTAALVYSRPAMVALLAIFLTGALTLAQPSTLVELKRSFENPPGDARIMMRWWWFGPAVTKPELEREMRLMKEGGIGGFEVQPTYPLSRRGGPQILLRYGHLRKDGDHDARLGEVRPSPTPQLR